MMNAEQNSKLREALAIYYQFDWRWRVYNRYTKKYGTKSLNQCSDLVLATKIAKSKVLRYQELVKSINDDRIRYQLTCMWKFRYQAECDGNQELYEYCNVIYQDLRKLINYG